MRAAALLRLVPLGLLVPLACLAQQPHEQEVQRALIELDRRAAGFSAYIPPQVGQPLHADPEIARQLRPYERMRMAGRRDRVLQLPPPVVRETGEPLPLPGRPEGIVDPVALPRGPG